MLCVYLLWYINVGVTITYRYVHLRVDAYIQVFVNIHTYTFIQVLKIKECWYVYIYGICCNLEHINTYHF